MIMQRHERTYPLLFQIALDVLPAQASAVACECMFSSSKETCMLRRSNISPGLLKALQMLKFVYKQDRIDLTDGLVAREEDYDISGHLTPTAIQELIATHQIHELEDLIRNSQAKLTEEESKPE